MFRLLADFEPSKRFSLIETFTVLLVNAVVNNILHTKMSADYKRGENSFYCINFHTSTCSKPVRHQWRNGQFFIPK